MRRAVGRPVRSFLNRLGYEVIRTGAPGTPEDCDEFTADLIERVRPYTLTSPERVMGLVEAIRYIVRAEVPGAFVECGVWRGGSALVMAETLLHLGAADRDLHLYDTFTHMPLPGEHDRDLRGVHASEYYEAASEALTYLPIEEVRNLLCSTGYRSDRLHLIPGLVEETIPSQAPSAVALCRLDTDWYESTVHELEHLWPRIGAGGVLLIDDYGHFMGARKAVDEFFAQEDPAVFLHRLDFSARLVVRGP